MDATCLQRGACVDAFPRAVQKDGSPSPSLQLSDVHMCVASSAHPVPAAALPCSSSTVQSRPPANVHAAAAFVWPMLFLKQIPPILDSPHTAAFPKRKGHPSSAHPCALTSGARPPASAAVGSAVGMTVGTVVGSAVASAGQHTWRLRVEGYNGVMIGYYYYYYYYYDYYYDYYHYY